MKHLLVLTSLFALSACGGGLFDWYNTALTTEPTANPANTSVTQITTDLNNVDLNIADGGTFSFTVDGKGVITGISGDINADRYYEQGTHFVGSDNKYDVYTLSSGNLKYSDFGRIDDAINGPRMFAGGDIEKLRNVYTKSEIEAIASGVGADKKTFYGTAVGVLKEKGSFVTETRTDAAVLAVSDATFQLNMPFYSGGDGNFYNVTVNGSYDYKKGEFVNGPDAHTVIFSGPKIYGFDTSQAFSETGHFDAYGDTTATEAVGVIHLVGSTEGGSEATFDTAFGGSK